METKLIIGNKPLYSIIELEQIDALWNNESEIKKQANNRSYNSVFLNNTPSWVVDPLLKWAESKLGKKFTDYNKNIILHRFIKGDYFDRHQDNVFRKDGFRDILIGLTLNNNYKGGEFIVEHNNNREEVGNIPGIPYIIKTDLFHEVQPVLSGIRKSLVLFTYEKDFVNSNPKINLL